MDAVSSALQMQQASLDNQVQFAVARKSLDMAKLEGKGLVKLIEVAAQLGKAVGTGEQFDALG